MKILKIFVFILLVNISCKAELQLESHSKSIPEVEMYDDVDIITVRLINGKEETYSELDYNDFYMDYNITDKGLSIYKEGYRECAFYPKGSYEKVSIVNNKVLKTPVEREEK